MIKLKKRTKTRIAAAGIVTVLAAAAAAVWRLRRRGSDVGEESKP